MIGYYVHHQGRGHLTRARAVAARLHEPVTVLTSLPRPYDIAPFDNWVQLPADDVDVADQYDVDAGGALHWAPLGNAGYRTRMAIITRWIADVRPVGAVVDVSVEVTAALRLAGLPVVVIAGAGARQDPVHDLAHRLATGIVAPWPREVYEPPQLVEFADKTTYVGAFSRFDDARPPRTAGGDRVLALFGAGGSQVTPADLAAAQAATPEWSWRVIGGPNAAWVANVWDAIGDADVVVTHAGLNAVAEVAAARRPAVVIAEPRPHGEQQATAAALHAAGIATGLEEWPPPAAWPHLLNGAVNRGGETWKEWNSGDGAVRAAVAIEETFARAGG